jgi:hypothetical protein
MMNKIVKVAVEYTADHADAMAWDLDYDLKGVEWDARERLDRIAIRYGVTDDLEVYDA